MITNEALIELLTLRSEVDDNGTKCYYNKAGEFHRVHGPAIERATGSKEWWLNGKRHREDGPAVEWATGGKAWWLNGKRHREDGPAIERANGGKEWWVNGEFQSILTH